MVRGLSEKSRARREEMIGELLTLFLAEGFAAFSVEDLARRLRCSKSTLYLVAPSKEQIVVTVVRAFFKGAAARIEARVAVRDAGERLASYLEAVAGELRPASPAFYADLAAFAPANEVYLDNTRMAAGRVRDLVAEGVEAGRLRPVDASFVGAAVGQVMAAVQRGEIKAATGLDDAEAYRRLADLLMTGLTGDRVHR
ncbi:AcrR family transcriptional regulator [Streptosporangium becharense]|uniref:AcrR family transcriptional regulator n=1 Tax=Streptosporangium becharense TaxID=1816182 RepID=A0A7W9MEG2_9ACTN|nr:TetR/AcrR family transcriptional regulator [Streptosporangium becharense]MBB2910741.1 AcrR family transcriptional regulator [Streptosporangium becharense]MBB5817436.1 AcrR family transcriptional regulator [Streptosporangium becharense]